MLDEVGDHVGELPKSCLKERQVLCIDKTSKLLRYVLKGKVVQTLDVRFGVPGLETPTGSYRVYYRDRYATSGINGPDQPRAPMPYALFFNGDIAVHYSPTFAASGYYPGGGSHGCVNVADLQGVSWLFDQIPVGTLVHVYWS
jgi:lipoprotein-anchoring transpeptidase ErfK/SrfK